jgi:hypothetical protein
MSDPKPAFTPTDPALMLLQQIAQDMAAMRADVAALQKGAAFIEGLNLDGRLKELTAELNSLKTRVGELESQRRADLAQRKPWVFIVQEATKILVAAAGGALAITKFPHH